MRMRHPVFPHRVDDAPGWDERPVTMLSLCNSKYTGGKMMMAPNADATDGHLDLVRIGPMNGFSLLRAFPKIFKGSHVNLKTVDYFPISQIEFKLKQHVDVMVDGEVMKLLLSKIQIQPRAIEVVV